MEGKEEATQTQLWAKYTFPSQLMAMHDETDATVAECETRNAE